MRVRVRVGVGVRVRPAAVGAVAAGGRRAAARHGAVLVLGAALTGHRPVQGAVGVARRVGVGVPATRTGKPVTAGTGLFIVSSESTVVSRGIARVLTLSENLFIPPHSYVHIAGT